MGYETDPKADTDIEKDRETSQQPERKAHQSVLHQFFLKKSSAATKDQDTHLQLLALLMKRFGL